MLVLSCCYRCFSLLLPVALLDSIKTHKMTSLKFVSTYIRDWICFPSCIGAYEDGFAWIHSNTWKTMLTLRIKSYMDRGLCVFLSCLSKLQRFETCRTNSLHSVWTHTHHHHSEIWWSHIDSVKTVWLSWNKSETWSKRVKWIVKFKEFKGLKCDLTWWWNVTEEKQQQ